MNLTILKMVRSLTLDCPDMISQILWPKVCSTAVCIKTCLLHPAFKLQQLPYKIMFGKEPSIQYFYPFGAIYIMHVPDETQIKTSKLSPRGIKSYFVEFTESSKFFRLYEPPKPHTFTPRNLKISNSTKCYESTKIALPVDLPFDQKESQSDNRINRRLMAMDSNHFDNALHQADNGNPKLCKFNRFCPHDNNPNIGLANLDQELRGQSKLPDFIEKRKSKSSPPPPDQRLSSIYYKKFAGKMPPLEIDRSQSQYFSE
jgi:hypothetical protein